MHYPLTRLWIELENAYKHPTFPADVQAELQHVFRYPHFSLERARSAFEYERERIAQQLHLDPAQPFPDSL